MAKTIYNELDEMPSVLDVEPSPVGRRIEDEMVFDDGLEVNDVVPIEEPHSSAPRGGYEVPMIDKAFYAIATKREGYLAYFRQCPIGRLDLSYIEIFTIILFVFFNWLYLNTHIHDWTGFWSGSFKSFGKELGFLAQWNSALLFITPTRAVTFYSHVLGVSFERQIRYHRWVGRWVYSIILLHGLCFLYDDTKGQSHFWKIVEQKFFERTDIFYGVLSLLAYTVLIIVSLETVRAKMFEFFYRAHLVCGILFVVFGILHKKGDKMLSILIVPFIYYGLDLVYRLYNGFIAHSARADVYSVSDSTVKLVIRGGAKTLSYRPGQYVFLYIPYISLFESHPFSMASYPGDKDLVFFVKVSGAWTRKLFARHNKTLTVFMEGPYGQPSIQPLENYRHLLFVAGGIGITPIISLMRDYVHRSTAGDKSRHVTLIWALRDAQVFRSIQPLLEDLASVSSQITIHVHLSHIDRENPIANVDTKLNISNERPDIRAVIQTFKTNASRDMAKKAAVISCGPAELLSNVRKHSANLWSCFPLRVDLHEETFQL